MTRAPPRFPVPPLPHRTLRTPPPSLIMSPASGLLAMKSTKSSRSSSVQTSSAWRKNVRVSATVMGLLHIPIIYAIGAGHQEKNAARGSLPCPALLIHRALEKRLKVRSRCSLMRLCNKRTLHSLMSICSLVRDEHYHPRQER